MKELLLLLRLESGSEIPIETVGIIVIIFLLNELPFWGLYTQTPQMLHVYQNSGEFHI